MVQMRTKYMITDTPLTSFRASSSLRDLTTASLASLADSSREVSKRRLVVFILSCAEERESAREAEIETEIETETDGAGVRVKVYRGMKKHVAPERRETRKTKIMTKELRWTTSRDQDLLARSALPKAYAPFLMVVILL